MTLLNKCVNFESIQYISDIHLEFYKINEVDNILSYIQPNAKICVLAGDIGYPFQKIYEIFLCGISKKFDEIFLIHGNHEYYRIGKNKGKNIKQIIDKTNDIIKDNNLKNIHFLNNSYNTIIFYDLKH